MLPDRHRCSATVLLRTLREDDFTERYLSWFRDEAVTRFLHARNITREDAIEHLRAGHAGRRYHLYAICTGPDETHVGNLKIGPIDWSERMSDLVTVIGDRAAWGKGVATSAIASAVQLGFEHLDLRGFRASIVVGNGASLRCYTRAGFVVEANTEHRNRDQGDSRELIFVSCFNPFSPQDRAGTSCGGAGEIGR
jgi:RimJ/RimL family protein N-acetyltransferase